MTRKSIRSVRDMNGGQIAVRVAITPHESAACEYLFLENPTTQSSSGPMSNVTVENRPAEVNGQTLPGIDVLNTGYGDFELSFDPNKPDEVQKAKETITDMLKRGYAIFVRQEKDFLRVRKFDPDRNVYIIGSTARRGSSNCRNEGKDLLTLGQVSRHVAEHFAEGELAGLPIPVPGLKLQCSTNLVDWQPVQYLTLTNGAGFFTDYYAPVTGSGSTRPARWWDSRRRRAQVSQGTGAKMKK